MVKSHYSDIATRLALAEGGPKTFLFTSALDSEGKTTTAYSVALALAGGAKKTLLVDANFRNPSIGPLAGVFPPRALEEVLGGRAPFEEAVSGGPGPERPHCLCIGAGVDEDAFVSLLSRLGPLLDRARASYDFVVIDGPSANQGPAAPTLGRHADGVILVVRCDDTLKWQARLARERLEKYGGRIMGAALNRVPGYIPPFFRGY